MSQAQLNFDEKNTEVIDKPKSVGDLSQDEESKRVYSRFKFTSHWDFFFSMLGAIIGLGNVVTFPALSYKHGGCTFLLVCALYSFLIGFPMLCLEFFLGQVSGTGIAKTFNLMSPMFQGVGFSMLCNTFLLSLTYSLTLSYCVLYFKMSFNQPLRWSSCNETWNTPKCVPTSKYYAFLRLAERCPADQKRNLTEECLKFKKENFTEESVPSAVELYNNYLLNINAEDDYGKISWDVAITLFVVWFLVCCCLIFGLYVTSKIAYVAGVFPFVGVCLIFIACLPQDGAELGIKRFFNIKTTEFASFQYHAQMWSDALVYTVYSVNVGVGINTALSSYNPFFNNYKRDAIIIIIMDKIVSLISGLTLFAGIGIITKDVNAKDFDNFTQEDLGGSLAFIVYPEILSGVSGSQLWSVLFFLTLIVMALYSIVWLVQTVFTAICDLSHRFRSGRLRVALAVFHCFMSSWMCFMFGLKGNGHVYFATVLRITHSSCFILLIFLEAVVVFYIYGYNRFANDVRLILGHRPNTYSKFLFVVAAPLALFIVLLITSFNKRYDLILLINEHLPFANQIFAACASALIRSIIILFGVYHVIKVWRNKSLQSVVMPSHKWNPRKKADLAELMKDIEDAEKGVMGEFPSSFIVQNRRKNPSDRSKKQLQSAKTPPLRSAKTPSTNSQTKKNQLKQNQKKQNHS